MIALNIKSIMPKPTDFLWGGGLPKILVLPVSLVLVRIEQGEYKDQHVLIRSIEKGPISINKFASHNEAIRYDQ